MDRIAKGLTANAGERAKSLSFHRMVVSYIDLLDSQLPVAFVEFMASRAGKKQQFELLRRLFDDNHLKEQEPDSPIAIEFRTNLARLLAEDGQFDEAAECFRRTLEFCEQVYGRQHHRTAQCLNQLAGVLADQGKMEDAEACYQKALQIRRQRLGEDHPATAGTMNDLALLLAERGQFDAAVNMASRALRIGEVRLGKNSPKTIVARRNVAYLQERKLSRTRRLAEDEYLALDQAEAVTPLLKYASASSPWFRWLTGREPAGSK